LAALEREVLIALLEETSEGPCPRVKIRGAVRVTDEAFNILISELVLEKLAEESEGLLKTSLCQRLGIAVRAIRAGADPEKVGRALGWLEFEEIVAYALEENGYTVSRRFRFQAEGRRWEIDVLAARKPFVICAECKHWSRGIGDMTTRKIVEKHLEKVRVLSENATRFVRRLGLNGWERAVFVPATLSLTPSRSRIYRRIPVVSILELPSFLSEFEGQMDWLINFVVEIPPPKPKPTQTLLRRVGRTRK